jgi:hypothetical protein
VVCLVVEPPFEVNVDNLPSSLLLSPYMLRFAT